MTIELNQDETIILHGLANRMIHGMTLIGHLWLTNQRLLFCTRPLNFRHEKLSLPLESIQSIELRNIFIIFNQGIHIQMHDGQKYTFAVWNRKKWAHAIEKNRNNSL